MNENIFDIDTTMINPTFIFVDGSYYCFHRYYALQRWWKSAYPDEPLTIPAENEAFVQKYKKTFINNLNDIPRKLNLHKDPVKPILIVGKDCPRENIWRMDIFKDYKGTRTLDDGFMGGPFFKMAYEEDLFQQGGVKALLYHPRLEADDCIALSVKHLCKKYPLCNIYIITSDRDYLQLNNDHHNVFIYNLAFKNLAQEKSSTGNGMTDLKIKILVGDTSDNIPSVFPKCGPKTALKCVEDDAYFQQKMQDNPVYKAQYELNETLIHFDKIPQHFAEEFMLSIKK